MRQSQNPHGTFCARQDDDPHFAHTHPDAHVSGTEFSNPPSRDDWSSVQKFIHQLYVVQKLPLGTVVTELKAKGFRASERMVKQRCKSWGYQKNAKRDDWAILAILDDRRRRAGKATTVFEIHGQRRTVKDLHRFIRNQQSTPEKFLADAHLSQEDRECPAYIRALTLEPEDAKDALPFTIDSPLSVSLSTLAPSFTDSVDVKHRSPRDSKTDNVTAATATTTAAATVAACRPLQHDAGQICNHQQLRQTIDFGDCQDLKDPLLQMSAQMLHRHPQPSDIYRVDFRSWRLINPPSSHTADKTPVYEIDYICERCHRPSQQHFVVPGNVVPEKKCRGSLLQDSQDEHFHLPVSLPGEGSWIWVSRCFLACMTLSRGHEYWGQRALDDAAHHFDRAIDGKDNLILTAAQLTATILHTHNQDEISKRIFRATEEVVQRRLRPDNPIRTTIEYYTASANNSLIQEGFTSARMCAVYNAFLSSHGRLHPFTITSLLNYGFVLRLEDHLVEAERYLIKAYADSLAYFDRLHMQTVMSRAVLAGCLRWKKERHIECVGIYREVVGDAAEILGVRHPYVLRLKKELAMQLQLGNPGPNRGEVLSLWKEVVRERVNMLGHNHPITGQAKEEYQESLQYYELWTTADGYPSSHQMELHDLFHQDVRQQAEDGHASMTDIRRDTVSVELADEGTTTRMIKRSELSMRNPSLASAEDFRSY